MRSRTTGFARASSSVLRFCLCAALLTCARDAGADASGPKARPCAIVRRAVLDEPRLDLSNAQHVDRLVAWLGQHGFERLDGLKLPRWMKARCEHGDAYGSVVVLPRGVSPLGLFDGSDSEPLWLRYLKRGGRIVHVGSMPWSGVQSVLPRPIERLYDDRRLNLLGISWTWNGGRNAALHATAAARAWGIESADAPAMAMPLDQVTLGFHVYRAADGRELASDWFRNVRPDLPWSGLVKLLQSFDGNDDAALRSVWRAAHYCGAPVRVPALPPPSAAAAGTPPLTLVASASGLSGRREFVRGEQVQVAVTRAGSVAADALRLSLVQRGAPLVQQLTAADADTRFLVDTSPFADGDYELRVEALQNGRCVASARAPIGIRFLRPEGFNFEVRAAVGSNLARSEQEFADISAAGLELHTTIDRGAIPTLDAAVRHHLGFSQRGMARLPELAGLPRERARGRARWNAKHEPIELGGALVPSLASPEARLLAFDSIKEQVAAIAQLPSFRPYVLCNDDYSGYYGSDYSPPVLAEYKAQTGADAPSAPQPPAATGPIPDDEPWTRWYRWSLRHVDGGYNAVETRAATEARRDVRIGPVPGGAQVPLVQLWEASQYPPYNFGRDGFNLIASYYYGEFWQPVITNSFWLEIGRMGNRELPQWMMPDLFGSAAYTRNTFFHTLAGGVRGLAYFRYPVRSPGAWSELRRLGTVVQRIGPVQTELVPAARDIGILNSLTSNAFDANHTLEQAAAYESLMQAHFAVEMVCEDEIDAGRADQYRALLLHGVRYLPERTFRALRAYIAAGGLVLADATVPFELPGAHRLGLDISTGLASGAVAGTPRLDERERSARVADALRAQIEPRFTSPDATLVASEFEADGVRYTWFVDTYSDHEQALCRQWRLGPGPPNPDALQDWEARTIGEREFSSSAEYGTLPGIPYDLLRGRALQVTRTDGGKYRVPLQMRRLGGVLIAWLPAAITALSLEAPARVHAGDALQLRARVQSANGVVPGAVPVSFELRDPAGRLALESGVRATHAGVAALAWTPAVNDVPGAWTLKATELASDRSATQRVLLDLEPRP
jgi:hypothetical protein